MIVKNSRIMVTGGSGWIGSFLVTALLEENCEVLNYDIKEGYDILNKEQLQEAIFEFEPEYVFHLAAQAFHKPGELDPHRDVDINIKGALNLISIIDDELSYELPVVYTSSGSVYGLAEDFPFTEKTLCKPVANYGISKLATEYYFRKWAMVKGLPFKIARLSSVYGPFRTEGPVNIFINMGLSGKPINIYGDGLHTRDLIHISDVINGINDVLLAGRNGEIYNIGSGIETSMLDITREVNKHILCKVILDLNHEFDKFDTRRYKYDISKAQTELKYRPFTTLAQGISWTISDMTNGK